MLTPNHTGARAPHENASGMKSPRGQGNGMGKTSGTPRDRSKLVKRLDRVSGSPSVSGPNSASMTVSPQRSTSINPSPSISKTNPKSPTSSDPVLSASLLSLSGLGASAKPRSRESDPKPITKSILDQLELSDSAPPSPSLSTSTASTTSSSTKSSTDQPLAPPGPSVWRGRRGSTLPLGEPGKTPPTPISGRDRRSLRVSTSTLPSGLGSNPSTPTSTGRPVRTRPATVSVPSRLAAELEAAAGSSLPSIGEAQRTLTNTREEPDTVVTQGQSTRETSPKGKSHGAFFTPVEQGPSGPDTRNRLNFTNNAPEPASRAPMDMIITDEAEADAQNQPASLTVPDSLAPKKRYSGAYEATMSMKDRPAGMTESIVGKRMNAQAALDLQELSAAAGAASADVESDRWSLVFLDEVLEDLYQTTAWVAPGTVFGVKLMAVLALCLLACYQFWDALLAETWAGQASFNFWTIVALRWLIAAPLSIALGLAPHSRKWGSTPGLGEHIISAYVGLFGLIICCTTVLAGQAVGISYYFGLMVLTIMAYLLSGVRVSIMTPVIGLLVVFYAAVTLLFLSPSTALLVQQLLFFGTTAAFAVSSAWAMERAKRSNFLMEQFIRLEQEKSSALLQNILPDHVIEHLRAGHGGFADAYTDTTILFTDIVGFTTMSASMSAADVVVMLNELFVVFDRLTELHSLTKIKTIGDAYMLAGGVHPFCIDDHPQAVAECGLAMLDAIAAINKASGSDLKIRVGIHTGPLAAGVIGTNKYCFDLWGDTVNVASRMESTGVAQAIQVSADTAKRLEASGEFILVKRSPSVQVKGKGLMETFWLRGIHSESGESSLSSFGALTPGTAPSAGHEEVIGLHRRNSKPDLAAVFDSSVLDKPAPVEPPVPLPPSFLSSSGPSSGLASSNSNARKRDGGLSSDAVSSSASSSSKFSKTLTDTSPPTSSSSLPYLSPLPLPGKHNAVVGLRRPSSPFERRGSAHRPALAVIAMERRASSISSASRRGSTISTIEAAAALAMSTSSHSTTSLASQSSADKSASIRRASAIVASALEDVLANSYKHGDPTKSPKRS